ncbi:thiolase family protein [bacterium]|nr:thiolase family protein [bacterium]
MPVVIKGRKGDTVIDRDESIRPETSLEALAKLAPAFESDGQVTAGNAPGMNDGAAAMVIASREYAEQHGKTPIARIVGYGQAAVDPKWIFYAPVKAIPVALARAGWSVNDVDLFEINEAFAAQVLADLRGLEREGYAVPLEKVNVHGGAIALGHPLGASGARVLVTLIHAFAGSRTQARRSGPVSGRRRGGGAGGGDGGVGRGRTGAWHAKPSFNNYEALSAGGSSVTSI